MLKDQQIYTGIYYSGQVHDSPDCAAEKWRAFKSKLQAYNGMHCQNEAEIFLRLK